MTPPENRKSANLSEVYPMLPFTPVRGEGVFIEDESGRRVLDFYGGHAVASLGYAHPALTEAIAGQARTLHFQSNVVPLRIRDEAAEAVAAFAPEGLTRVFFVNSGAEANENALKIALAVTGRPKVVAIENSFHGRTAAAAAVTWGARNSWYGFPSTPMEVQFVPRGDIDALHAAVDQRTAALIVEPVQGQAGAYVPGRAFLHAAREACDRAGAMLIFDEVQTGAGRLGANFGATLYEVRPDLLTVAKALGGGFPCGATIMTQAVAGELGPGQLGTTFGGGPLACAAIKATLEAIDSQKLVANARAMSALIRERCVRGHVTDIQGEGLLLGLRTTPRAAAVRDALLARNILTGTSADPHILRLLPPLILEAEHVELLVQALEDLADESL